jgi:hypothetical protein
VGKSTKYFFALFLLFVLFFSFSTNLAKRQGGGFISDGASYFAIIQSLAFDLDLEYTREDIIRIRQRFWAGPIGLFLKKGDGGKIYYSKSFVYPLFAAPFFRIFDVNGILLFNGLMLFLSVLMAFLLLRQYYAPKRSLIFAAVFIMATVIPVYIWWIQADLFNFFAIFTGLFFFFYRFKNPRWFYLSALFLAAAVFSKPSNIVPIGIVYLLLLKQKQWKRFILLSLISMIICSAFLMFNYTQTGEWNYMGGERRSFHGRYPYEKPENKFDLGYKMTADDYWQRFYLSPHMALLNVFYFVFGRFTGIFIYFFPAVFILLLFFFQPKIPEDWFMLTAIIAAILIYLLLDPGNYFGGCGSVGNRYFLNIFPLFFFLGFKNRIFKFSLIPAAVSLIFLSGVYADSLHHSTPVRTAGMSFPIRLFPPEKTQYQTLQPNENPRAFGQLLRHGQRKYWVHFLNDHYWPVEEDAFWTHSNLTAELFIAVPGEFKEFEVMIKNNPLDSNVTIQVEHQRKVLHLLPNQQAEVRFKNVNGLRIKNRRIYLVKVRSERSYCPNFADPDNEDRRRLGVNVHIGFN